MSERAGDPLEVLRQAWSRLEPPAPDAEVADERTRAVLSALRGAWRALPVPAARMPARLLAARSARRAPWLVRAAAAALLACLGALLWRAGTERSAALPAPLLPRKELAEAPVVVAVDSEHLELRSGNVRLVLLTPNRAPAGELPE